MTGFLVLFPLIVVGVARLIFLSGIRVIPNTCLDIVEKRFGPSMLSTPPLVTIPQGKLGYVFAPDGKLLDPTLI